MRRRSQEGGRSSVAFEDGAWQALCAAVWARTGRRISRACAARWPTGGRPSGEKKAGDRENPEFYGKRVRRAPKGAQALLRLAPFERHVGHWVGHARQNAACLQLFRGQTWPVDCVAHLAGHQMAHAGAAGAVSARTRPVNSPLLDGQQQRLCGPGVAAGVLGLHARGEKSKLERKQ